MVYSDQWHFGLHACLWYRLRHGAYAFRLISIMGILMYPFIFMKYLKIGHYRSTCLAYSELLAYFALIMMLISKYGLCRSSIRNYANHHDGVPYPNTLLCNYQSCHVSRLCCRNPAMCLSLKKQFSPSYFCYLAIDRLKILQIIMKLSFIYL